MNEKSKSIINIVKGIAIILVVFTHTIVPSLRYGYLRYIWRSVLSFHMPVFFLVSGLLFENYIDKYVANKTKFIKNKFCKLMIPYFSYSFFLFLGIKMCQYISPLSKVLSKIGYGDVSLGRFLLSVLTGDNILDKHIWFVYSTFIIFVIAILLGKKVDNIYLPFIFFVLYNVVKFTPLVDFYAFKRAIEGLIYFSVGRLLINNKSNLYEKIVECKTPFRYFALSFSAFIIIFTVDFIAKCKYIKPITSIIIALLGICFTFYLAAFIYKCFNETKQKKNLFIYLGKNSFPIYLFHHPIVVLGFMEVLLRILPLPNMVLCVLVSVIAIVIPLLLNNYIITKIPLLSFLFLGDLSLFGKTIKNRKT